MSDTPSAFPPPPQASMPPPVYQQVGQQLGSSVPTYQPPPVSGPPVGYPQGWQQQMPPAVGPGWTSVGVLSQFSGPAAWACGVGLVTIIVPFVFGRVFFFLPIIGVIYGFRAIQRGKLIGGVAGIVLSAIGGILTLIGIFAH